MVSPWVSWDNVRISCDDIQGPSWAGCCFLSLALCPETTRVHTRALPPFHIPSFNWKSFFSVHLLWLPFHLLRLILSFTGLKILHYYFIGKCTEILVCFLHLSDHPVNSWEYVASYVLWLSCGLIQSWLSKHLLREERREGERQGREGKREGGKKGRRERRKLVLSKCIGMEYMTFKFHLVYFLIKLNAKKNYWIILIWQLAQLVA